MSGVGQEQTKPPEHQTSDMVGKRKSALPVGKAGESWGYFPCDVFRVFIAATMLIMLSRHIRNLIVVPATHPPNVPLNVP